MITRVVYIFMLLCSMLNVNAQEPFSKDIWLNEAHARVKVNCMAKDILGYTWLGTDEGLYRYSGRQLKLIETPVFMPITALSANGSNIIAGFEKGAIGIWDGHKFSLKELHGEVPHEIISSIYPVGYGIYILATLGDGLYMVQNNYCTNYAIVDGLSDNYVYKIYSPAKGILLAATDQGINQIRMINGRLEFKSFTSSDGLPDNIVRVLQPFKDKTWIWIGTHQGGLALYCSRSKEVWTPAMREPWQWGQVNDILSMQGSRAWVATEKGFLLEVNLDDNDSMFIYPCYYPGQKLYKLLEGKGGNIFCATDVGLKYIPAEYARHIPLQEDYKLRDITAMVCDDKGNIWFSQKNKLHCCTPGQLTEHQYTANSTITRLYCDEDGTIWMGTFGDGLWYSTNGKSFCKARGGALLQNESILDISGSKEKLWVAGLNGVQEFNYTAPGKLSLQKLHNKNSGIGSDYVYMLYCDEAGSTWMATDGAGICQYTSDQYTHWDSASGLISKVCYNIVEDDSGRVMAGTYDKGLLVYENDRWTAVDKKDGLQNLKISSLAPFANGRTLIVHAQGIDEWFPWQQQFKHYNIRQGIGIDSVSTTLNVSAEDDNGNVYIPYTSGLAYFKNYEYLVDVTPRIVISGLQNYEGKEIPVKPRFKYDDNRITVGYDAITASATDEIFYRYKLKGYNDDWILTSDQTATFSQLPSGSYKFIVQASLNEQFEKFSTAAYSFTVDKPFWFEVWFIVIMAGLVWGLSFAYIRIRERNLRKLAVLQKERMMFEYENLRSQVNPHFLFNSLNTLAGLIEDDTDAATTYTRQLSDLYRNMLSHKDKDLITLAEEWDIVENYVYIQQSRFGAAIQLDTDIPEHLKKVKKVVPMALQLLLENAIKHNIVSRSQPLVISFKADRDRLIVSNNYQPKMSKEKGAGLGLVNIRKRYALHTKQQVSWQIDNKQFIVEIPLI